VYYESLYWYLVYFVRRSTCAIEETFRVSRKQQAGSGVLIETQLLSKFQVNRTGGS
jgi:hypothetical protein